MEAGGTDRFDKAVRAAVGRDRRRLNRRAVDGVDGECRRRRRRRRRRRGDGGAFVKRKAGAVRSRSQRWAGRQKSGGVADRGSSGQRARSGDGGAAEAVRAVWSRAMGRRAKNRVLWWLAVVTGEGVGGGGGKGILAAEFGAEGPRKQQAPAAPARTPCPRATRASLRAPAGTGACACARRQPLGPFRRVQTQRDAASMLLLPALHLPLL